MGPRITFSLSVAFLVVAAGMAGLAAPADAADWPQYRFDGSRSGCTPERIGAGLSLRWLRHARHAPHRAWVGRRFALSRMRFDWAPAAVVAGGTVYFGSSADHKVYALDAATGRERWAFFTRGPVRLAPAVSGDRVLAGSDDGHLYCLDRETGALLWKHRAGPSDEKLVGNGRMVSRWPVRGGVAVRDGVAYFGAGIWPEEDVYICAVDVATGEVLWTNDSTGALEIDQPHMVCFSRGGVIAQGYLAVTAERLFVATGRSTPAVFDRTKGGFLYYHLSRYGAKTPWGIGGGDVVAGRSFHYNSGLLFDSATGLRYSDRAINSKWWRPHITPDGRRANGEFHPGDRQGVAITLRGVVRYEGAASSRGRASTTTRASSSTRPRAFATPTARSTRSGGGRTSRPTGAGPTASSTPATVRALRSRRGALCVTRGRRSGCRKSRAGRSRPCATCRPRSPRRASSSSA